MSNQDLFLQNDLSSTLQVVKQGTASTPLYLAAPPADVSGATGSATLNISTPPTNAGLTVNAAGGDDGIVSIRPSASSATRTHFQGFQSGVTPSDGGSPTTVSVFSFMVENDSTFCLNVNGNNVFVADKDGNVTLNVSSLKIVGLSNMPTGTHKDDLQIGSDGTVSV